MKNRRIILLALCCALLFFSSYVSNLTIPDSADPSPRTSWPESSPDTALLGDFAQRAEEGETLPASLLLAPAELSDVLEGDLTGYARLLADGWVFEWLESDDWEQGEELNTQEEKLIISGGSGTVQVFDLRDFSTWDVAADRKLVYRDVDFDGWPDILACTGHHGNQGALTYWCFLQREGGFEACGSFTDITNPAVDEENQLILSSWRDSAAAHGWGIYAYQDGEFTLLHVLHEEPAPDSTEEEVIWEWSVDGTVIGRSDELTEVEIDDLLYNENSEWGFQSGRWSSIYQ